MAKCRLDADEPKLSIIGNTPEREVREGLHKLRDKVAQNHSTSMWFNHPMKGFPQYKDMVWEWDFKPPGDRSSTRPGWRVLAFVPDPHGAEPILARPFICWDKSQAPKKNIVPFIVDALKKFLSEHIQVETEEDTFRYIRDGVRHIATCQLCFDSIESRSLEELEILKDTHNQECPRQPPF